MDPPKFAYIWIYRRIAAYNGWDVLLMLLSWMLMVFGFTPFIESSTSWATPWYQHNVHLLTQINLKLIHFDWSATGQPIHAPPVKTKSFKKIERKMESEGVDGSVGSVAMVTQKVIGHARPSIAVRQGVRPCTPFQCKPSAPLSTTTFQVVHFIKKCFI